jgi:putative peptidoglycan lipid II flippase
LPIAVCLICYGQDILQLLYFRGAFDSTSLKMTSNAFTFYAAGLLVAVIEPVLIMASYAFSDTKVPLVTSLLGMGILMVLLQVLTPLLGLGGIALSVSLTCLVRVAALMLYLEQYRRGGQEFREVMKICLTSLACSIVAFAPISFLRNIVPSSPGNLLFAVLISSGLYLAIAHMMMNEEAYLMRESLSKRLNFLK